MNVLAQWFLNGILGVVWAFGFMFGLVAIAGVIGLFHTLIGVLFGGEPKDGEKE